MCQKLEKINIACYLSLKALYIEGGNLLNRVANRRKKWQICQSQRAIRILTRDNKRCKKSHAHRHISSPKIRFITAPVILSLVRDPESTICFFNDILNEVKKRKIGEEIYLDLSRIEVLSIDAVMYIIALIKNISVLRTYRINFSGNQPLNKQAAELLDKSGFYKFVYCSSKKMDTGNDRIQITDGKRADVDTARKICDFINKVSGKEILHTKKIYPMIVELMTNTYQHAYKDAYKDTKYMMDNYWYVSVETTADKICIVFLDTGAGIPKTISKKWHEKLFNIGLAGGSDAEFIASALEGAFRTETKQKNRGKGLPEIYQSCITHDITDLTIISGKGKCYIEPNGTIERKTFENSIFGTLFCWNISK